MSNNDIQRLVDALRKVVNAAIANGIAPRDYEYAVLWWEPYDANGSTGKTEVRRATNFRFVADVLSGDPSMVDLRAIANELRTEKWPDFVLDYTAEILCATYLKVVGSVAIDESILQKTAAKYIQDVQCEEFDHLTVLQVAQFNAAEAFTLNDAINFRPITVDDINRFGYEPIPVRGQPRLNKRDWICTINQRIRHDDLEALFQLRAKWDRFIGALGLVKEGDAWFSLLFEGPLSPFLMGARYGSTERIHSSPEGGAVSLGSEDIDRYRAMLERIDIVCDKEQDGLFVAFRRFRAAANRSVLEDKIADLAIGMESLLVPDSSTGEISFKFRLRGAALLPDRFGSTPDRIRLMKTLYDARCKLVHGKSPAKADPVWILNRASDSFRTIFSKLAQTSTSIDKTIARLDEHMVKGGESWSK